MKHTYSLSLTLLTATLLSCTTAKVTEQPVTTASVVLAEEVKPIVEDTSTSEITPNSAVCITPAPEPFLHIVNPPPPITGTEREVPIVLMTKPEFNKKIQLSPLWDILLDRRLNNANYGNYRYYFNPLYNQIGSNTTISFNVTTLKYGYVAPSKRLLYGNQLLDQERYEMIETLTLVIDDRDKATDIIDTLYQQYMDKVNNKAYLSDGQTIHTFVEYDGKYIAMTGWSLRTHHIPKCNFEFLEGITIN